MDLSKRTSEIMDRAGVASEFVNEIHEALDDMYIYFKTNESKISEPQKAIFNKDIDVMSEKLTAIENTSKHLQSLIDHVSKGL